LEGDEVPLKEWFAPDFSVYSAKTLAREAAKAHRAAPSVIATLPPVESVQPMGRLDFF